jgi:tetratricopeptide (TPR) repeat protein
MNLGYLAVALGDRTGVEHVRRAIALLERVVAERPDDANRRMELLSGYARIRQPLVDDGRVDEAIAVDRKLFTAMSVLVSADPSNRLLRRNLGVDHNYLGRDLRAAGRAREAVAEHRKALAIAAALSASDPASSEYQHDVAITHYHLANALADVRALPAAHEQYRRAAAMKEAMRLAEPSNARHADDLALIYTGIASVLAEAGALDAADEAARRAVPLAEAAAARAASNQRARANLAAAYLVAGRVHARRAERRGGRDGSAAWREARRWYGQSLGLWQEQRRRGTLSALDAAKPALIAREIARCDAALAAAPSPAGR